MAVNITITGNIYDETATQFTGTEAAYQVYFYNGAAGGSNSTWSNKRYSIFGQYNFNLADSDLLTTAGSVSNGDIVVIVFWTPNSADRVDSCSSISLWGCYRVILGTGPGMISSDLYVNEVQIKPNICPNLYFSLPTTGLIGQTITCSNTSTDTHQWTFSGNTIYQRNVWYTNLMSVNTISSSTYKWGDLTQNTVAGITNGSHQYITSGDYNFEIVIEDGCECTVTGTDTIRISANTPVPNIVMIPASPVPNEAVTFQYTGTDSNNSITNIAWIINDSGVYGNTNTVSTTNARDDIVSHSSGLGADWYGQTGNSGAFTNPGSHLVSVIISWWDGFNTQTINYSETFTQSRFVGPTVDFTQVPAEAVLASGVKFINTSTNTSRVGLGLPDNIEYNWTWTDGSLIETELDKTYSFSLEKYPTTASCSVELCAQWSDGWDTKETCTEKDVVFGTVVTITEEDCYYNLNIIGTSDDGSATGYGWTVYSGSSIEGPWEETWESPIGLDQNDKKICFTSVGWFKIIGTVYGTGAPTSDNETIYITTVCPATSSIYNVWNGTGVQDVGSDWIHSGFGVETAESKHLGTNGLDASGMKKNSKITFRSPGSSSIFLWDYDFLRIWINLKSINQSSNLTAQISKVVGGSSSIIDLNSYIDITKIGYWQKVLIPLEDFGFSESSQIYVDKIDLISTGDLSLWLDDVAFIMGITELETVAVCAPKITGNLEGTKKMSAKEIRPSMKGRTSIQNPPRIIHDSLRPFPGPTNL